MSLVIDTQEVRLVKIMLTCIQPYGAKNRANAPCLVSKRDGTLSSTFAASTTQTQGMKGCQLEYHPALRGQHLTCFMRLTSIGLGISLLV